MHPHTATTRQAPTGTRPGAATPTPAATPAEHRPRPRDGRGYLASTIGGIVGGAVLAAVGGVVGSGIAIALEDPDAGMGNLWLLVFPLGLGVLGIIGGVFAGILAALRRRGHHDAMRTAVCSIPLTLVMLALGSPSGIGLLGMLAVPAIARRIAVVRTTPPNTVDTRARS